VGVLKDRVAIVTGAAKGIGEGIAEEFAREEGAVALVDIDHERASQVAAWIESAGGKALAVEADVADEAAVQTMVARVLERFGNVHILVNNAGVYPRHVWHELSGEQWDRVQAVNLKSCFLCARAVFPYFRKNGFGKIINLSSAGFQLALPPNCVHYLAAKGGVVGFTRALARDVGELNIQVNAIAPGAVEVEEERKVASPEMVAQVVASQILKSRVLPIHIARAAVFLASADSDLITGQTLNVDAGRAFS